MPFVSEQFRSKAERTRWHEINYAAKCGQKNFIIEDENFRDVVVRKLRETGYKVAVNGEEIRIK